MENHPRHMRRLFVYHLEHSCQCHLVTANVGAAPNRCGVMNNFSNKIFTIQYDDVGNGVGGDDGGV